MTLDRVLEVDRGPPEKFPVDPRSGSAAVRENDSDVRLKSHLGGCSEGLPACVRSQRHWLTRYTDEVKLSVCIARNAPKRAREAEIRRETSLYLALPAA